MSKGSGRRPLKVSRDQFDDAWDKIFEKKNAPKVIMKDICGAPSDDLLRRTVDDIYEDWYKRPTEDPVHLEQ